MKKSKKLVVAMLMVMAMIVTMLVPTMAATTYTAVEGTSTTFKKYLVMDVNASVPSTTFKFTVSKGTAIPAVAASGTTPGTMEVLEGIGTPTIADVTFAAGQETFTSVQTGDSSVTLNTNQKYAKNTATISFAGIEFPEPGVYRYIVTETANTTAGITCDTTEKTLDVYVTDDGTGTLAVSSYVLHTGADAPVAGTDNGSNDVNQTGAALTDKIDGIQNAYGTHNLFVGKEVSGNQASRDKYFAVTVVISNLHDGDILNVSLANDQVAGTADGNADANSGTNAATTSANASKANVTTMTANASGTATATFYLQHGQYVAIQGLPTGAHYVVTEEAEDYKKTEGAPNVTATLVSGSGTHALDDPTSGDIADADVYTGYTNTRNGIIPTGIITKVGPVVGGAAILVVAIIILSAKSNKDEDEEEEA
ncbi:Spy0128 family protein [uncultured Eubacterium sp.]|uniref:DUF7601 domain-containing protein n=1 Tax=uncultured Eubacterium sp. TaxID=165185 RepID=UPI000E83008E|nr:FctA domain-containing protein [uncultured Eubacterium sp.]HAH18450.1 hypothetical protein [Eubacterium sp.]HAV91274.1 hypothetical protein [Eubacterium sp.]